MYAAGGTDSFRGTGVFSGLKASRKKEDSENEVAIKSKSKEQSKDQSAKTKK